MRRAANATGLDPRMLQPSLDAAFTFQSIARAVTTEELVTTL